MNSHITYRVPYFFIENEARFSELVAELEKNRKGFDSVALFNSYTHSVISLEVMRLRCALLKRHVAELKRHGWETGIDLICSTGFFKEFEEAIPSGFGNYTDINGEICAGVFCPNQEKYRREYLTPLFAMLAETEPDFIWLDDDNSKKACCCEHCLELFNQRQHTSFTREELRSAFNSCSLQERMKLRMAHIQFAIDTNQRLYSLAEEDYSCGKS